MYRKAIILTAKDVQDEEFIYPYYRLQEAGYDLDVVVCGKEPYVCKYGSPIRPAPGKSLIKSTQLELKYDLVVIPGGWAPEAVRMDQTILNFVHSSWKAGYIISAICHGPQVLISAHICRDKKMTCFDGIASDLINAGACYAGRGTFVDGNIVTADHYRENHNWMRETLRLVDSKYVVH